jgi:uncharacterized protein YajQ (UPF0234 family)
MELRINIVELASELADKELREKWDYRDGQADVDDGHGVTMYSEEAKDTFNRLYDEYYTIIEQCKQ